MNVHKICDTIEPILNKFKDEEYIEMEFRLGKYNGTFFDTNIGEKMYVTILKGLNKYTGWERIETSQTDVFYREKDNLRISIDESTNEETIVKKERVCVEDFKQLEGTPFDIRFSVRAPMSAMPQYMAGNVERNRVATWACMYVDATKTPMASCTYAAKTNARSCRGAFDV